MAITIGASTSAAGATGTKPTCSVGDVLVAVVGAGSAASTISISGFTNVFQQVGIVNQVAFLLRQVDGSEGSSFTASDGLAIGLFVVPGASASALDASPTGVASASSSASIPGQTTVTNGDLILAAFMSGQGAASDNGTPSGMTEVFDVQGTGSQGRLSLNYQAQATAGATGTKSSSTTGSLRYCGAMIVLKEKPASVDVNIAGQVAAVSIAGLNGSISVTKNVSIAGQVAAVTAAGINGAISVTKNVSVSGQVAGIAIAGLNGAISVTKNVSVAGEIAPVVASAIDGVISVTKNVSIAGEVAPVAIAGLDGAASAVRNVSLAGEVAAVSIAGLDGAISITKNVSISGQVAAVSIAGLNGSISVTKNVSIAGQIAGIAIAAIDGSINAEARDIPGFLLREPLPEPVLLDRAAIEKDLLIAREIIDGDVILDRAAIEKDLLIAIDSGIDPIQLRTIDGDAIA